MPTNRYQHFNKRIAVNILLVIVTLNSCNQTTVPIEEQQPNTKGKTDAFQNDSNLRQVLYHGDCSYSLAQTEGWDAFEGTLQMSKEVTILVMYKPNDSVKHSSPIAIYSNVVFKEDFEQLTTLDFMNGEEESASNRGEQVLEAKSIKTQDNNTAIIRKYIIESVGEYFAVAYIDEPKHIIMITFSTKDVNDFKDHYKSFENIVKSYKYLGS
jgi:hypothetical protein